MKQEKNKELQKLYNERMLRKRQDFEAIIEK